MGKNAGAVQRFLDSPAEVRFLEGLEIFKSTVYSNAQGMVVNALAESGLGAFARGLEIRTDSLVERNRTRNENSIRVAELERQPSSSLTRVERKELAWRKGVDQALTTGENLGGNRLNRLESAYRRAEAKETLKSAEVGTRDHAIAKAVVSALFSFGVMVSGAVSPSKAIERGEAIGAKTYEIQVNKAEIRTHEQALAILGNKGAAERIGREGLSIGFRNSNPQVAALVEGYAKNVGELRGQLAELRQNGVALRAELGVTRSVKTTQLTVHDLVGMETMTRGDIDKQLQSLDKTKPVEAFRIEFLNAVKNNLTGNRTVADAMQAALRDLNQGLQPVIKDLEAKKTKEGYIPSVSTNATAMVRTFVEAFFRDIVPRYEKIRQMTDGPNFTLRSFVDGKYVNQKLELLKFLAGDRALTIGTGAGKTDVLFDVAAIATKTLLGVRWNSFVQVIPESLMAGQFSEGKIRRFERLEAEFGVRIRVIERIEAGVKPEAFEKLIEGADAVVLSPMVLESLQRQATSHRNNPNREGWVKLRDRLLKNSLLNIDEIHLTPDTAALIEGNNTVNLARHFGADFVQEGMTLYKSLMTVVEAKISAQMKTKTGIELGKEYAQAKLDVQSWMGEKGADQIHWFVRNDTPDKSVNVKATALRLVAARHVGDYLSNSGPDGVVFIDRGMRDAVLRDFAQHTGRGKDFVERVDQGISKLSSADQSALAKLDALISVASKKEGVASSYGVYQDQKAVHDEFNMAVGERKTFKQYVEGSKYGQLAAELKAVGINLSMVEIRNVKIEDMKNGFVRYTVHDGKGEAQVYVDSHRAVPKSEVRLETDRLFSQKEEALAYEIFAKATNGMIIRGENVYLSLGSTMTTLGEVINFVSTHGGRVAGWTGTLAAMSRTLELVYGIKTDVPPASRPGKLKDGNIYLVGRDLQSRDLTARMGDQTMLFVESSKLSPREAFEMGKKAAATKGVDHIVMQGESGKDFVLLKLEGGKWVEKGKMTEERAGEIAKNGVKLENGQNVDLTGAKYLFISDRVTGFDPKVRAEAKDSTKFILVTDRDVTADRLQQGVGRNRDADNVDVLVMNRSERERGQFETKQFWGEAVVNGRRYSQEASYREINSAMKASMGNILRMLMDNPAFAKDAAVVEKWLENFESKSHRGARSMVEGTEAPSLSIDALRGQYRQYQVELQTWARGGAGRELRQGLTSEGKKMLRLLSEQSGFKTLEFADSARRPDVDPSRGLYGSRGLGDFADRFHSSVQAVDVPREAPKVDSPSVMTYLNRAQAPRTVTELSERAATTRVTEQAQEAPRAAGERAPTTVRAESAQVTKMVTWLRDNDMTRGDKLTTAGQYWAAQYLAMDAAWSDDEQRSGLMPFDLASDAFETVVGWREQGYLRVSADRTVAGLIGLAEDARIIMGQAGNIGEVVKSVAGDLNGLTLAQAIVDHGGGDRSDATMLLLKAVAADQVAEQEYQDRMVRETRFTKPWEADVKQRLSVMGYARAAGHWIGGQFTTTANLRGGSLERLARRAGLSLEENRDQVLALSVQGLGLTDPTQRAAFKSSVTHELNNQGNDIRSKQAVVGGSLSDWLTYGLEGTRPREKTAEVAVEKAQAAVTAGKDQQQVYIEGDRKWGVLPGKKGTVDRKELETRLQYAQMSRQDTVTVTVRDSFAVTRERFLNRNGRRLPFGMSGRTAKWTAGIAGAGAVAAVGSVAVTAGLPVIIASGFVLNLLGGTLFGLAGKFLSPKMGLTPERVMDLFGKVGVRPSGMMGKQLENAPSMVFGVVGGLVVPLIPGAAAVAAVLAWPLAGVLVAVLAIAAGVVTAKHGVPLFNEYILPTSDPDKLSNKQMVRLANESRAADVKEAGSKPSLVRNVGEITLHDIERMAPLLDTNEEGFDPFTNGRMLEKREALLVRLVGGTDFGNRTAYNALTGAAINKAKGSNATQQRLGAEAMAQVTVGELSGLRVSEVDGFWKTRAVKILKEKMTEERDSARGSKGQQRWALNSQARASLAKEYGVTDRDVVRAYGEVRFGDSFTGAVNEIETRLKKEFPVESALNEDFGSNPKVVAIVYQALGRNGLTHAGHMWAMQEIFHVKMLGHAVYNTWLEALGNQDEVRSARVGLDATQATYKNLITMWGVAAQSEQADVERYIQNNNRYLTVVLPGDRRMVYTVDQNGLVFKREGDSVEVFDPKASSKKPLAVFNTDVAPTSMVSDEKGTRRVTVQAGNSGPAVFEIKEGKVTPVETPDRLGLDARENAVQSLAGQLEANLPVTWANLVETVSDSKPTAGSFMGEQAITPENLLGDLAVVSQGIPELSGIEEGRRWVAARFGQNIADSIDVRALVGGEDGVQWLAEPLSRLVGLSPDFARNVLAGMSFDRENPSGFAGELKSKLAEARTTVAKDLKKAGFSDRQIDIVTGYLENGEGPGLLAGARRWLISRYAVDSNAKKREAMRGVLGEYGYGFPDTTRRSVAGRAMVAQAARNWAAREHGLTGTVPSVSQAFNHSFAVAAKAWAVLDAADPLTGAVESLAGILAGSTQEEKEMALGVLKEGEVNVSLPVAPRRWDLGGRASHYFRGERMIGASIEAGLLERDMKRLATMEEGWKSDGVLEHRRRGWIEEMAEQGDPLRRAAVVDYYARQWEGLSRGRSIERVEKLMADMLTGMSPEMREQVASILAKSGVKWNVSEWNTADPLYMRAYLVADRVQHERQSVQGLLSAKMPEAQAVSLALAIDDTLNRLANGKILSESKSPTLGMALEAAGVDSGLVNLVSADMRGMPALMVHRHWPGVSESLLSYARAKEMSLFVGTEFDLSGYLQSLAQNGDVSVAVEELEGRLSGMATEMDPVAFSKIRSEILEQVLGSLPEGAVVRASVLADASESRRYGTNAVLYDALGEETRAKLPASLLTVPLSAVRELYDVETPKKLSAARKAEGVSAGRVNELIVNDGVLKKTRLMLESPWEMMPMERTALINETVALLTGNDAMSKELAAKYFPTLRGVPGRNAKAQLERYVDSRLQPKAQEILKAVGDLRDPRNVKVVLRILTGDADNREISDVLWTDNASVGNIRVGAVRQSLALAVWDAYLSNPPLFDSVVNDVEGAVAYALSNDVGNNFKGVRQDLRMDRLAKDASTIVKSLDPLADRETMINLMNDADPGALLKDVLPPRAMKLLPKEWQNRPVLAIRDALNFVEFTERPAVPAEAESETSETVAEEVAATIGVATAVEPSAEAVDVIGRFIDGLTFTKGDKIRSYSIRARLLQHLELLEDYEPAQFRQALARLESAGFGVKWGEENPRAIVSAKAAEVQARADRQNQRAIQREDILRQAKEVAEAKVKAKQEKADARLKAKEEKAERAEKWARGKVAQADAAEGIGAKLTAWWDSRVAGKADRKLDQEINIWLTRVEKTKTGLSNLKESRTMLTEQEERLGQMEDTLVSSEKAVSTLESLAETKRVYRLATTVEGGVEQAEKTIVARAERELGVKRESSDFLTDLDNRVNELRAQLDPRYRGQQTLDDQKKAIGSDLKEVRARRAEVRSQLDRVNALIAKDTEALEQEGVPEQRSKPRNSSFSVSYVQESRPSPYDGPKNYVYGAGETTTGDEVDFVEAYEGYYSPATPERDQGIEYGGVPVMEATRVDNRGQSANVEVYEYKRAASFGSVDPKTQIPYGLKRNDQGMFILDREFEFVEDENGEYPNLPDIVTIKDYLLGRLGELLLSVGGKTRAEKEILYVKINNVMETSRGVKGYFEDYLYRKIGEAALDQVARSKGEVKASDQAMFSSVNEFIYGELTENPIADDSPGLSTLVATIKLTRQETERIENARKDSVGSSRTSLIDPPTPPEASSLVTAGQGWAAAGSAALTASLVVGMVLLAAFDMTGFVAALAPLVLAGVGAFGYYLNQWRLEIGKDNVGTKPTAEADHGTKLILYTWDRFSELMETKWTRWFNPLGFWNPHAAAAGVLWHEQAHLKLGAGEVGAALAQVMPTFVSLGYYVANQWAGRDKKLEFVSGDDTNAMVKALETGLTADGLKALVEKARNSGLEKGGQIVYGLTERAELVVHEIRQWEGAGVQATNASLVVNPTAIQPAKMWMPVHVHVVENLDARFPIPSVMDWLSRAGNHQGLVLDRAGNATLYKLEKGDEGLVVRLMSRRVDEMQFGPSVSVPLGQYLLEAVKRGETVPLNGANASLLVGLVSASLQEMDLMPARLTLDQINRMEEALRRSVAGRLTSENVPMATSAVVRAYFNAHGEGARPYVGALADMARVNAIAAEVLRGWGLMPFIPSTRESVIIPKINRATVVSDVMGRMEPGLEKSLGDAIRNGNKSEILRIMADVSNRVMVPAYEAYLGYPIGSKVQVGERPSGGEGMAEIAMKKTSTGIEFEILLDLGKAQAADLLAEVNHEVAEAFIYAGMGEFSTLKRTERSDLESLAVALSRRVAEKAGLKSLGDMGHALFLADARDHDLRRVDAQRVAEGFIDAVDRTLSGSARTEMFQTAFARAGQGDTLLELTGQVVFPTVIAVDAKSFLNDQGAVDNGTVDSIVQKFSGDSNESTYLLVVDNLGSSAQAERAQLKGLLSGYSRVVLGKEGQGLRNGKINRGTLRSAIPIVFKWDSSLVPMVRLGAMSTNQEIWEGLVPTALKGNVAANLLEALRASRLVDLSA
ncbi:MAG: hypothetical protein IPN19_02040 [Elusimicrobia bacterium]|nr:hypothetical protein [Elusimicrobiota bacterium]